MKTQTFLHCCGIALASCLLVNLPTSPRADTYSEFSQATIGDISVSYGATPPQTRQDLVIGIGESVGCSFSGWLDCDYNITQSQIELDFTYDHTYWYVSGDGTLSGNTGTAVTMSAKKKQGGRRGDGLGSSF